MNAQEIFDTVAKHLFTQGRRAMSGAEGICSYRGESGTSCAVGCLIPNGIYTSMMEGNDLYLLLKNYHNILPDYFSEHPDLLSSLQIVHDSGALRVYDEQKKALTNEFVKSSLYKSLTQVAERYKLNTEVLDTLHVHK